MSFGIHRWDSGKIFLTLAWLNQRMYNSWVWRSRCFRTSSTTLLIREIQIIAVIRHQLTPTGVTIIQKQKTVSVEQGVEKLKVLYSVVSISKIMQSLWKVIWGFLK